MANVKSVRDWLQKRLTTTTNNTADLYVFQNLFCQNLQKYRNIDLFNKRLCLSVDATYTCSHATKICVEKIKVQFLGSISTRPRKFFLRGLSFLLATNQKDKIEYKRRAAPPKDAARFNRFLSAKCSDKDIHRHYGIRIQFCWRKDTTISPNGEIYHNNFAPNGDFYYVLFAPK